MNDTILSMIHPVVTDDLERIGRDTDGGYLINRKSLIDADMVSFGINDDWSFEAHFHRLYNGRIEMYDGSVSVDKFRHDANNILLSFFSLAFVYSCIRIPGYFNKLIKKYKESKTLYKNFKNFTALDRIAFHSKFVSDVEDDGFESIEQILGKNKSGKKIFLKIDIEGYEYRILKSVSLHAENITGMAIEFHDVLYNYEKFSSCITELCKDFHISHVHANNYSMRNKMDFPQVWEITFIHKSLLLSIPDKRKGNFPIAGMDFPNTLEREDFSFTYR
jgi:hypothetical protein